ncbi:hypothetical protein BTO06_03280 [Tenacibaculum sp. SZ-18]|uniref:hypothetical protein n=1 Tax=Tenacibaculum sp. SZ-18 TaxID=754423 RepID=UPI000C2D1FC2|nr:hypothetical protein [Tenacibaculum sp. SZ-18]AUC14227.1 hypothetical protein BTO06_03280 [Tenacibaculum sp. SZ-18]
MRNSILLICFLVSSVMSFGQKDVTWDDLSDVKFTNKYFPKYEEYYLHPEFAESIKELNGQQISITGYFLSLDPKGQIYILSKGPMASCYFCGVGGPETAIELLFSEKQKYKTDTIVTVTGTLTLNDSDVDHFNYILSNCTVTVVK